MGLPPPSRQRFTHGTGNGSPTPRRPPRNSATTTSRSRSLELLEMNEDKSSPVVEKPETPRQRPRSKSFDNTLDDEDSRVCNNPDERPTVSSSVPENMRISLSDEDEDRQSKLTKAKSCGAGIDYDRMSSVVSESQDSVHSLSSGIEPKRKKNFMDKCVNKVRSLIKK